MAHSLPIIEVNGLSKRYKLGHFNMTSFREEIGNLFTKRRGHQSSRPTTNKDFWALRDISFSINRGEVVGIIGRNGAGKSTLLKILSRITEPTTGEAVLRGRVASLLEVGTGFHPELSGRENIFLNGAILGMKRAEIAAKFDEIVDFAEVGQFIDTPVKRYSSGMYVRLAFAVAAHLEPDILIVDEVLAVGDAAFQKKCVAKMDEVSGQGRTVLFVSHNVGLVSSLCERVILLKEGSIKQDGEVDQVLAAYATEHHGPPAASLPTAHSQQGPAIKSVTVTGRGGAPSISPDSGYEITIEATGSVPHMGALVFVTTMSGTKINYFNTALAGDPDCREHTAPKVFQLVVEKSQLLPGSYNIEVGLAAPSGMLAYDHHAATLEIWDGYFQGRSSGGYVNNCLFMAPHKWTAR